MKPFVLLALIAIASHSMATPISIGWLHHSVGRNLINDAQMRSLLDHDLYDHDYNYGCGSVCGLRYPDGSYAGHDWDIPGDGSCGDISPGGLDMLITLPSSARDLLLAHDVVVLKSCYSDARFYSDSELNNAKAHYLSMRASMISFPNTFIIISPPPSHRSRVSSDVAARGRELSIWMAALEGGNVHYFNLFGELAGDDDYLLYDYERSHYSTDSHPNTRANEIVGAVLAAYINEVAGLGTGVETSPSQTGQPTRWGTVKTIWR